MAAIAAVTAVSVPPTSTCVRALGISVMWLSPSAANSPTEPNVHGKRLAHSLPDAVAAAREMLGAHRNNLRSPARESADWYHLSNAA